MVDRKFCRRTSNTGVSGLLHLNWKISDLNSNLRLQFVRENRVSSLDQTCSHARFIDMAYNLGDATNHNPPNSSYVGIFFPKTFLAVLEFSDSIVTSSKYVCLIAS